MAGFAPLQLYLLPWVSLALLALLWLRCGTLKEAALLGFSFGAGLFLCGTSWIYVSLHVYGGMASPIAALFTLLFCLLLACFPALACALASSVRAGTATRLMLLFPAVWSITEWMRTWVLTGFPWLAFGYSQVPESPLAGYAPILGVFGASLATAVVAGALAFAAQAWLLSRAVGKSRLPPPAFMAGVGLASFLVIAGIALKTHAWTEPVAGEPLRVSLLQGNIPQELKWRPERALATLQTYLEMARAADGRLILLPETALPLLHDNIAPEYLQALADHALRNGGDLLFGVPERDTSGNYFNSVMSLGGAPAQTYRKHHLVPFGDYLPLRPVFGWVMKILHIPMGDFSRGAAVQKPMQVAGQKVAVNICYEDVFGEEIIRQLPEATILANFTNDAWWGDSAASRQHAQIAQMRALETGRPMLRVTNTGVTAIIDPQGRMIATVPEFIATVLNGEVQGYQGSTPYVVFGNYGFLALALGMVLLPTLIRGFRAR